MTHHAPMTAAHNDKGYTERTYAAALRNLAQIEGRKGILPPSKQSGIKSVGLTLSQQRTMDALRGEMTANDMACATGVTMPAAYRILDRLYEIGRVTSRKDGKTRLWRKL